MKEVKPPLSFIRFASNTLRIVMSLTTSIILTGILRYASSILDIGCEILSRDCSASICASLFEPLHIHIARNVHRHYNWLS